MKTRDVTTLIVLVLVALAAAGCAQTGQASEDYVKVEAAQSSSGEKDRGEATLKLEGEPGTEFSGSCTVGDEEPEEISGQVPQSFTFNLEGKPLDCKISSEGDIQVELTVGENVRSVQRFSGGTSNLIYENGSISSSVSSSSGSSSQVSSSQVSSSSSR